MFRGVFEIRIYIMRLIRMKMTTMTMNDNDNDDDDDDNDDNEDDGDGREKHLTHRCLWSVGSLLIKSQPMN